ncbi:MAG TPA: hypothetical protein VNR36_02675 [Pseudolysinimonas sp.]|nr:hypothetical protein [Pseudolysinimonas sp.]
MTDRPTPARWREPSRALTLRWGIWAGRSAGGLWLIVAGGVAIAGSSVAALWLTALGIAAHVIGWAILPAAGWRRAVVLVPSTVSMVALLPGPTYLTVLVVPFLCWLLARHRPLRVWPMGAFVVAAGIVLGRVFPDYSGMPGAAAVALLVLAGAAWAARAVHAASTRPRRTLRRGTPPIS